MRTKIVKGKFYLKKPELIFLKGKIRKLNYLNGVMLVVENEGITYAVFPVLKSAYNPLDGFMFPIIENYDEII